MLSYLIYLWSPFVLYVFIYYYFCGGYKPINKNINDITQDLGPAPPLSTTKKRAKQTHPRLYQRRINKIATLHATLSRTGGRRERENFCREKVQFRGKKKKNGAAGRNIWPPEPLFADMTDGGATVSAHAICLYLGRASLFGRET